MVKGLRGPYLMSSSPECSTHEKQRDHVSNTLLKRKALRSNIKGAG